MTITNSKLVIKIDGKNTVNQILDKISQKLVDEGFATSKKSVLDGFKAREKQSTTGLADGIAIPHVSSDAITEAKIVVAKLSEQTDWKALDGQPTDFVIAIAVPANGRNDHFELLTNISGKLADPKFVKEFKKSSNKNIVDILNNMKSNEPKATPKKSAKGAIKVVGVTTCVTGVAHTFLAAQALEDEGKKRGWDVKIERQGQMTKNKLTQADIDAADYVIIGESKSIDGKERFNGKKVHTVEVAEPITQAARVFDEMINEAKLQKGSGTSTVKSTGGKEQKQSVLQHMMAGISFMIPYIAMAGIVLGLTTAFGFKFFPYDGAGNWNGEHGFSSVSPFANAFNTLAGQAFGLYIPVLAMFIANSIAGRKAMAPAAILAMTLNLGPAGDLLFAPFFNWETLSFLGWTSTPALGFLGGVVSGYMIGYGIHFFTKLTDKVESLVFQSVLPLLIIPILFTVIPYLFMAFFGYLPLYYIAQGLNWIVIYLYNVNMLWLAGGLMGAMICFDLGGPINKIAMAIGVMMLDNHDQSSILNGVAAVAVSIPAVVLFFSWTLQKVSPIKMDKQDNTAAASAALMGFFGITEGAIPFAAKDSKKWIPAFVTAGFIGGIIASFVGVVDNVAMWGGPIIWLAGGYGSVFNTSVGSDIAVITQAANWTWTLLYFVPLVVAGFTGFVTASGLEYLYSKREEKASKEAA